VKSTGDESTAQTDLIRQMPITANDVVYNPSTKMLYASVPSSVGAGGNSIATIDPVTGAIGTSVFIGSEPKKLVLADDNQTLYASLEGAAAIGRFNISSQTAGQPFPLGHDSFFGTYILADLAVAPGNPNLIAVARSYRGVSPPEAGVAVFDNGVQRPTTTPGHIIASDFLAFSASATKLYGGGFYSGLNTMTIDASGVSITSTKTFGPGNAIRFDNGLVYGSTGQVINPDSGNLVGTFPGVGSGPFTTDSSVGRAYFLTGSQSGSNYSVVLRAFDINTFLQLGTLTIPSVNGQVSSLVRWGSNGLAFRTDGGQLFLIQTTLIPSADPIPSPTPTPIPSPTPTPTPIETFVRQVALTNNDLVFSKATQMLYASVPSSVGSSGNSITPINPATGTVGAPVFIGSEPTKLALSEDGQTLYAGLDGAAAVRKFDVISQTAGLQFSVGLGSFNGPLFVNDLSVMPGSPNTVAVSRANRVSFPNSDGVAIYDNGVPRTKVTSLTSYSVEFSNVPTRLYSTGFTGTAGSGAFDRLAADASGATYLGTVQTIRGGDIRFDNGLLYQTGGDVSDPEAGIIKGSFTALGSGGNSIMTTDSALGRAFFVTTDGSGLATLRVFDLNTFVPLGSINLGFVAGPPSSGTPSSLVRWGTNGLAFRNANRVFVIQTSLVSASGAVPTPTPTPSPTPTPTPTPYVPTFVRQVNLPANDLVYSQANQTLYASVPSVAGANGNSITPINPQTGTIGPSVFIGSEPNKLALADDESTLHVSLDGAAAIRRFDIPSQTAGAQFAWGTSGQRPLDMAVVPGSPAAVAISDGTGLGVAVYDNGVPRSNTSKGNAYAIGPIAFGATPSVLYGYDSFSSGFELVKFSIDGNGVSGATIANNLLYGYVGGLKFANGLLYQSSGRVANPEAKSLVGTFQNIGIGSGAVLTVDPAIGRVFFLSPGVNNNATLTAYDTNTFLPIGSVTLSGITGNPVRLVRWGVNGLAFNTVNNGAPDATVSHVYILQSALVSTAAPIPIGVQLGSDKFFPSETIGTLAVPVTRTGDVSGSTSVNYATSDGTATAGADYTATSGTLTFAPGELTKAIQIPIIDDNIYEGPNESFNVTISAPSGGAILNVPSAALVTIGDNEIKPSISVTNNLSILEGNSGITLATFNVTLSSATVDTVTVDYATSDGTATAGSDYVATSGKLTFAPGTSSKTIDVQVIGDTIDEPDETFLLTLSNATNVSFIPQAQVSATIINDDGPPKLQFTTSTYQVSEGAGAATISVTRFGRATDAVSVDYQTTDGSARQARDYTIAAGTLQFAPGETSKTFDVLITDDAYIESAETVNLSLSNAGGNGASLGSPITARLTIIDNDTILPPFNPIDDAQMFVKQHYADFLSRAADPGGLNYWTSQITQCGNDAACIRGKRIDVSNAFFYELEYQQTGSYVYRLYRAAFGNNQPNANPFADPNFPNEEKKLPNYSVFAPDRARVAGGASLAQAQLNLASAFVQRSQFVARYPASLDGPGFVDAVLATIHNDIGVDLTSERQFLIDLFNSGGRGAVLYRLADDNSQTNPINNRAFIDAEYNRAFVATQYFGYLRRDADMGGFLFWLGQVSSAPLRDVPKQHAMVCSFVTSAEYQQRFSSVVTHFNSECPL